jgi:predicted Zn finger-like uncharacterized protein
MKITCDNCGAKYSIADEKVKGKVFKIRCKKCSHIVVVRGTSAADSGGDQSAEVAQAVARPSSREDVGPRPVWHVVVGREQVGPCTANDLRERYATGEINGDSYVWREGFADWMRLAAVEEFSGLVQPTPAGGLDPARTELEDQQTVAAAPAGGAGAAVAPSEASPAFDTGVASAGFSSGGDEHVAEQAPTSSAPAGGSNGQSGGLFSAAEPSVGASAPSMAASTPSSSGHRSMFGDDDEDEGGDLAHPQMTGQRGENSVLFSLANLQALAMGGSASADGSVTPSSATASSEAGAGGSGLIDIRAMAASATSASSSADDDLPVLSGLSGPVAAAPVLLPSASSDRPAWLLPTVLGLGALFVLAVVLLVVLLVNKSDPDSKTGPVVAMNGSDPGTNRAVASVGSAPVEPAGSAKKASAVSGSDESGSAQSAEASGEDESEESAAGDADEAAEEKTEAAAQASGKQATKRPRNRRRRAVSRRRRAQSAPRAAAPTPAPAAKSTTRRERPKDELDRLLEDSMNGRSRRRASGGPSAAANSDLPDRLSRAQIVKGMRAVKPRVQRCYDRYKVPGLADVRLKIGNDGRVRSAVVKGLFTGTPTGSCVSSAVKTARFPRFKVASMSITYPFMLR